MLSTLIPQCVSVTSCSVPPTGAESVQVMLSHICADDAEPGKDQAWSMWLHRQCPEVGSCRALVPGTSKMWKKPQITDPVAKGVCLQGLLVKLFIVLVSDSSQVFSGCSLLLTYLLKINCEGGKSLIL